MSQPDYVTALNVSEARRTGRTAELRGERAGRVNAVSPVRRAADTLTGAWTARAACIA